MQGFLSEVGPFYSGVFLSFSPLLSILQRPAIGVYRGQYASIVFGIVCSDPLQLNSTGDTRLIIQLVKLGSIRMEIT